MGNSGRAAEPPQWLKEYLRGRQVDCVRHAGDRYARLLAVCYAGGENINDRLVAMGGRSITASIFIVDSVARLGLSNGSSASLDST